MPKRERVLFMGPGKRYNSQVTVHGVRVLSLRGAGRRSNLSGLNRRLLRFARNDWLDIGQ